MSKRYDDEIDVEFTGSLIAFTWRGRRYYVDQHLSSWREMEWDTRRSIDYLRVLAHPAGTLATGDLDRDGFAVTSGAVYELICRASGSWRLVRIWD